MLLSLDDDCLENICKLLPISDQVALATSCQRLRDVLIERIWERNCKTVILDPKACEYFNLDEDVFKCFMGSISSRVEHLSFESLRISYLNTLSGLKFPKLQSLNLNESYIKRLSNVVDLQFLTDLFPHLKKLELSSPNVSGKGICKLKTLEELEINDCKYFEYECFPRIFAELKLRALNLKTSLANRNVVRSDILGFTTLETLTVGEDWSRFFLYDLRSMPFLKKVKMYSQTVNDNLALVTMVFARFMKTVIFNKVFKPAKEAIYCMTAMQTLQRFIVLNAPVSDDCFQQLGTDTVQHLLEIRLIGALTLGDNAVGFFFILRHCINLEILDVSCNNINKKLLLDIIAALGTRIKPILICCFETEITTEDLKSLELPHFFEISLERSYPQFLEEPFIQCEFQSIVQCRRTIR